MKLTPHGGDIQTFKEQFACDPLDYSANTNPQGMAPLAKEAIRKMLDEADRYPDPHCRELRCALSSFEGVLPEQIICGNGAADLIFRIVGGLQPKKALLCAPTFAEYEEALEQQGTEIEYFSLEEKTGFALTEDIIKYLTPSIDMVFLCEPNNPTGRCSSPELLEKIARYCHEAGIVLVVDECFNGFLDNPESQSLKHLLPEIPSLIILKAFTKIYGMAGVRLGYVLCSDRDRVARIKGVGQHWAVSSLAQAAGCAALGDTEWLAQAKDVIACERDRLAQGLSAAGCKVYPSRANYLFFYGATPDFNDRLARRGVLIRDCSNYRGLGRGYFRIAVRAHEDNDRFLEALRIVYNDCCGTSEEEKPCVMEGDR